MPFNDVGHNRNQIVMARTVIGQFNIDEKKFANTFENLIECRHLNPLIIFKMIGCIQFLYLSQR